MSDSPRTPPTSATPEGTLQRHCGLPGAAFGVERYCVTERRWNGVTTREGRLTADRGWAYEVSFPEQCRIALGLEGGRAVCRSAVNRTSEDGRIQHPISYLPAGMNIWGCGNEGGSFRLAMLAVDPGFVRHKLGDAIDLSRLDVPQLNCGNERLRGLMLDLIEEANGVDRLSPLYADSLIVMVLIELFRSSRRGTIKRGGLTSTQLRNVLACLEEDMQQRVSLRELAAVTGLSVSHFCRAFKNSTGVAPYTWQLNARIHKAQQLVSDRQKSFAEIAQDLGFADQSHFTRTFRRCVGVSPRVWLRNRC